jgi:hypothetical protein
VVANAGHKVNPMNKTLMIVSAALLLLGTASVAEAHVLVPDPVSVAQHPTSPSQWNCIAVEGPDLAVPPCQHD